MTGLIGWWPLHESAGSTARDLSGNRNHGSLNGGVTQGVAGKGGLTAYSFDGIDGEVNAGNINSFGNHDWTTSLWIKVNSIPDKIQHILHWGDGDFTKWWLIHLKDLSGDGNYDDLTVHFDEGENKNTIDIIDSNIDDEKYHHLTVVHRESDKYELYIDGELLGKTPDTDTLRDNGNNSLYFAGDPTGNKRYFNGTINDIRTYRRALNPSEIQTLYEWGSGDYTNLQYHNGSDSGAVSRWKFDGDISDSWGSNDGTDNTSAGYSSNAIRGQSKIFDRSSSDYIDISSPISVSDGDAVTISCWANFNDLTNERYGLVTGKGGTFDMGLRTITSGEAQFYLREESGDVPKATSRVLNDDNWYHLAGTWKDATDNLIIYVNGVREDTKSASGVESDPIDSWNIGRQIAGTHRYFNGKIDDIRVYNRALPPSEVFQLYQWGTRGRDMRKLTVNSRGNQ